MKKNYFTGIIGALIGGILFTLPWILVYVYANWLLSILGAVIGFGAFTFYKLFKGKVDKKTPVIIIVASILSITIATFIIIPFWLIAKEGHGFSVFYFKYLYTSGEFVAGIIGDYIISLLFTMLGISGIITSINKEYSKKASSIEEIKHSDVEEVFDSDSMSFDDKVKYLESVYEKYNAFSKETAVSEFKIMKDLKVTNKLKFIMEMEKKGIIAAPFIKSYFDKEAMINPKKAKKNRNQSFVLGAVVGTIIGILIVVAIGFLFAGLDKKSTNTDNVHYATYTYESISIELPDTFKKVPNDKEDATYAYYLNYGEGITSQVMFQEVTLNEATEEMYSFYEKNYKLILKENYKISEEESIIIDNLNGFKFKMVDNKDSNQIYYNYVVFNKNKVYIIAFFVSLDSGSDTDVINFKNEVSKFMDTVKYKS